MSKRVISTLDELVMLEPGTVLQGPDWEEETYKCVGAAEFLTIGSDIPFLPSHLVARGPYTVIWEPSDGRE
ncbi:hypothetical protein [Arthrobacter sp. USHLN218]|uniref:hypothetical protein n=1 Tax=Arthrobacter sp. USHLN218 TaxID=3081232 RepID=UPI0030198B43